MPRPGDAAEAVRDAPVLATTGSGFSVSLSDANQAADVLIALRRRNADIVNATVDQPSLDEVFLALTGQAPATPVLEPEASNA